MTRAEVLAGVVRAQLRAYTLPANVAVYLSPEDTHDRVADRCAPLMAEALDEALAAQEGACSSCGWPVPSAEHEKHCAWRLTEKATHEGERGGAEVLAAVGAVLQRNEAEMTEGMTEGHGAHRFGRRALADDLRAALADPAGALAEHDAEVLRAAADDYDSQRGIPEGTHVGTWLRERADRIAGDQP